MTFRITGLSPAPFLHLFGLPDAALARRRATRVIADGSFGHPERIEMRDATAGQSLLLVNYEHLPGPSPYRASHAVYVREDATDRYDRIGEVPDVLTRRMISLRAFSAADMMVGFEVADGKALGASIERLFGLEHAAYLHAHYAGPGCYAARIDRA